MKGQKMDYWDEEFYIGEDERESGQHAAGGDAGRALRLSKRSHPGPPLLRSRR